MVLLVEKDDWPAVVRNMRKAQRKSARVTRVLIREAVDAWTSGQIYLALVQSVLLYISETWVMTPHTRRVLGGFHHRVAHRLTGRQPRRGRDEV